MLAFPMADQIEGRCLCGAVKIQLEAPAGWVGVCHCRMCQRWSGSLWAGFPADHETITVTGPVRRYRSSQLAERAFCETCGSHLWMRDHKEGAPYDLMPGLFDESRTWPLQGEIYVDEAMASMAMAGQHRRATAAEYRAKNPETEGISDE